MARPALGDDDPSVRATALGALDRLGDLSLGDVERAAADPAPGVRSRAAELAWHLGPAAGPVLVALLADSRPEVVEAACFGLGELGRDAGAEAVDALARVCRDHSDPLCREAAVAAIGAVGADSPDGAPGPSAAGLPAVLAAMGDKPAIRRRAVLALASFEGPEVEAALEAARADRDWQVRQAAEDLTGRGPVTGRRPTS